MTTASCCFCSNQSASYDAAQMRLDRFSDDVCDRTPSARGLVAQLRVKIVGEHERNAPHGRISRGNEVMVPRDGIEPPTRGFSVLAVADKNHQVTLIRTPRAPRPLEETFPRTSRFDPIGLRNQPRSHTLRPFVSARTPRYHYGGGAWLSGIGPNATPCRPTTNCAVGFLTRSFAMTPRPRTAFSRKTNSASARSFRDGRQFQSPSAMIVTPSTDTCGAS